MNAPLHPVFVHFPIALFTVGTVLYAYAYFRNDAGWEKAVRLLLWVGWIVGLFAVATGLLAFSRLPNTHPAYPTGLTHMAFAFTSEILYLLGLFFLGKRRGLALIFCLLGLVAIFVTGFFGGELVYTWGVGVMK